MATNNGSGGPYDYGREMGDEQLRNVQARLKRLYSQAADDVSARLDTFLERFDAKDQLMRERVEQGLISQDEYILWRQNSILRSVQMEAQIEALTNDLVNVDELAVQMINGDIPDVYCSAYNFEGFRGETMARLEGYNYSSFSIYNANAVRIITTEDPDLIPWQEPSVDIPKDRRWNRRHIQDAITQGILAGDDMRHLSARLLPLVNMDQTAAMRTARTSYIGIQNQARRDATARIVEAGIPMEETWVSVLQANTRDTHLMLHGTHPNEQGLFGEGILRHLLRFPGDPNGDAGEIYNCQCGVTSHIAGIDHSDQRDRYARFMTENYYEDWIGDKENGVTGVSEYRLEETRAALERKRRLDTGEIRPRGFRQPNRIDGMVTQGAFLEEAGRQGLDGVAMINELEEYVASSYGAIALGDQITEFIENAPAEILYNGGTLYRGLSFDNEREFNAFLNAHKVGDTIVTRRTGLSWTASEAVADQFSTEVSEHAVVLINNDTNRLALGIQNLADTPVTSAEVLWSNNVDFTVERIEEREGVVYMYVEQKHRLKRR